MARQMSVLERRFSLSKSKKFTLEYTAFGPNKEQNRDMKGLTFRIPTIRKKQDEIMDITAHRLSQEMKRLNEQYKFNIVRSNMMKTTSLKNLHDPFFND
jgi:hypothetical protein